MSKTKKLIFMIAGIVVLAAAVFGVVKYNEYQASLETEESSSSIVLKNLLENDKTNIASINLQTQNDSITLIPSGTDSSGNVTWVLEGHEDWNLTSNYSSIVSMAALFQVYKEIETDVTDSARLDEFGLKNPSSVVTITLKDGTVQKVRIGDLSSDKKYTFCMLDGDTTVYACNATYNGYATYTKQTIRRTEIENSINIQNSLKSMYVQKKGERAVELEYVEGAADEVSTESGTMLTSTYRFIQPYTAKYIKVRQDIVENYFKNLTTPTVIEMIDSDCEDLDQYGLGEEPEYREKIVTVSSEDGSESETDYYFGYTYGSSDEYIYFREAGSTMVLGVDAACMADRNFEPFSYVNRLVYLNSITNVASGTISYGGQSHEFTVKRQKADEESSVAAENLLAVYRFDGVLIETDTFLNWYRSFLSIAPDYEILGEEPEMDLSDKLEVTLVNEDGTEDTLTYYRMSEFYYVIQADEDTWFACSDTYIENVLTKLDACEAAAQAAE